MATNLTPEQLQKILALRQNGYWSGANTGGYLNGVQQWYDPTVEGNNGWRLQYQPGVRALENSGDSGAEVFDPSLDRRWISKVREGTGGKLGDWWNEDGTYGGTFDAQDGGGRQFNTAALMFGGALAGNLAMANAGQSATAAGGAASGSGMTNGAFLGEGFASGVPAWDAAAINSALGSGQLGTAGSYLGQTMSGGTGLETIGKSLGGSGSALGSGASSLVNGAKDVMGATGGLNAGGLLGAVAGAIDSKDSEQKQSRDPWEPAQPFLKQQIGQGMDLSNRYQQQPFSQAQQTAYGNVGGLLDAINANAGGLLGGFNATASGANNFVRGQRPTLTGSQFNLNGFAPGLLGSFGTRG